MDGKPNGDRANRAVKATAAYEELKGDIRDLNFRLFGDDLSPGPIIRLIQASERQERNPMIRLGNVLSAAGVALVALAAFLAACATVIGGIYAVRGLGLWP